MTEKSISKSQTKVDQPPELSRHRTVAAYQESSASNSKEKLELEWSQSKSRVQAHNEINDLLHVVANGLNVARDKIKDDIDIKNGRRRGRC